jgi:hypothetical protein
MTFPITQSLIEIRRDDEASPRAAYYLRTKTDFSEQCRALSQISNADIKIEKHLLGKIVARSWNETWCRMARIPIKNSQKSISWLAALLYRFQNIINEHVSIAAKLYSSMLNGEWEKAKMLLSLHQEKCGLTLWSLRWLLLLAEEMSGQQTRLKLCEEFRSSEFGPSVSAFVGFYNLAADPSLPEEHYTTAVRQRITKQEKPLGTFLELSILEDYSDPWEIWEVLSCSELCSLVDRYEFFLRIAAIGLATKHQEETAICRGIGRISKYVNDFRLSYLADVCNSQNFSESIVENKKYISAWDNYMKGNYSKCFEISYEIASNKPELLGPHELLIKSSMYLGQLYSPNNSHPLASLYSHLQNIFLKNDQAEESLSFLLRFASRFCIFSLSAPLRSIHSHHATAGQREKWQCRGSHALGIHGPRNFEYGHSLEANRKYLAKCSRLFQESAAVRFFCLVSECSTKIDIESDLGIPPIRWRFFSGIAFARKGARLEAVEALTEFLQIQSNDITNPLSPFATEEARKVLIEQHRLRGDVANMLRLVFEAYIERSQFVRRLPMKSIYDFCAENISESSRSFEYPLVASLACDDPHLICIALREFMRVCNVIRPIEIAGIANLSSRQAAILLLRVCTPEVLDSIPVLDTVEKVEGERLAILEWITKNAPQFARAAETEVLRLTQNAQLREALQKIEGAKVVLNVTGLREAEQDRFADAFFRYAAQRSLAASKKEDAMNALLDAWWRGDTRIVINSEEQAAFQAFAFAFRSIRDAFIASPHFGIEACLSSRIRHGIVIQHIRKPLAEHKLAMSEDATERKEIESYWQKMLFIRAREVSISQIVDLLANLTKNVNAIAEEVRANWIQSRTEARNAGGLFNYSFDDDKLEENHYKYLKDVANLDTFLDGVFDVLLERTRKSLKVVQTKIDDVLRVRLINAVDNAISALPSLGEEFQLAPIRNALVNCRQDFERSCEQMKRWFQGADASLMTDARFELVARTAIGMVERLNPDFRGRHRIDIVGDYRVKGRYFTAFVHNLFFILENAIRHRDVPKERFVSHVLIRTQEESIWISVKTEMSTCTAAADSARKINCIIAELECNLDPAKVVKEGGSGFAKIMATMRYEFKQDNRQFCAMHDGAYLSVAIKCKAIGLSA